MSEIAIGIGSNKGDRLANIRKAVHCVRERVGAVVRTSDVFETPPWGVEEQPRFLNACILAESELSPYDLMSELKEIETLVGRIPRERWGPREIDLDILFYGDLTFADSYLTVPHARLTERAFVLVPLAQIAPDAMHAPAGRTISHLLAQLPQEETDGIVRIVCL